MTTNQWVELNYSNIFKWLKNVTRGKAPELYEDFVHEVIMIFLEHDKAQELVDRDEVRWFLTRIAMNQWRSVTSPWAKREWGQPFGILGDFEASSEEYSAEDDAIIELLVGIVDDMHLGEIDEYYMSLVVMIYHELDGNFSEMSRRLDIPRTSLAKVYKEAIKTIQQRLELKIQQLNNGTIRLNHNAALVYERWSELTSTATRKASEVHTRAVKLGFFRDL